jgi:hypothetical protein
MKELDDFLDAKEKVFKYFEYKESHRVVPIVDFRKYYWAIIDNEAQGEIVFHEEELTEERLSDEDYYTAEIYTQRFLKKWVYRKNLYTMIYVDIQIDDNKFLAIFSNKKEKKLTKPEIINI